MVEPSLGIHLPEDLIIDILLRFPVKSLLRFRSVCKLWNATISGVDFINKHFHHHSNDTGRHLVYWSVNTTYHLCLFSHIEYCFSVFSSDLVRLEKPDYLELPGHVSSILGPCNGIFCIYVQDKELALWNPATRRLMPLPFSDPEDTCLPRFLHPDQLFAHGFGIDPLTNELKIVVLDNCCDSNMFAVYRLSSRNPWMFKYSDKLGMHRCTLDAPVFLNGFIYWRIYDDYTYYPGILAFDLHNEVFEVILMPEAIRFRVGQYGKLDSYDESLAIFSGVDYKCIDIWVMKEMGSWIKLRTVVMPCDETYIPLGFWNRNKILVSIWGKLLAYDPETQTVNLIVEKNGHLDYCILTSYKESLASVKGGNELQDYDLMSAVSREFFSIRSIDYVKSDIGEIVRPELFRSSINWQVCLSEAIIVEPSLGIHLPEDLIIDILLRFPVKSLLRFRSVCKLWNATISGVDFINKHFHHHSNDTGRHLVYWSENTTYDLYFDTQIKYCFSVFSSNLERLEKPDYLDLPGHVYSILGPCNGIFCVYVLDKGLALWNPATRRLMPLPFSDPEDTCLPRFLQPDQFFAHGFGIDPLTNELKIVVIDNWCDSNMFAVYRSSSRIPWMFKYSDKLRMHRCTLEAPVFLNAFIYWRIYEDYTYYPGVLAFDLHNEVFEVILMPEAIRFRVGQYGKLDSYDESLAIFSGVDYKCIDIWVMKEMGSWIKLRTVVMPCEEFYTPLEFWNRNKILVSISGKLLVYDPETQTVTLIVEKKGDLDYCILTSYKESLASVKGGNELQDYDLMSAVSREFFSIRYV